MLKWGVEDGTLFLVVMTIVTGILQVLLGLWF